MSTFWWTVADTVTAYTDQVPHLAHRYDLFVDEFPLSCLNRLQVRDNQQMVDLADPSRGVPRQPTAFGREMCSDGRRREVDCDPDPFVAP
jgi:siderophore synthetase component